MHTPVLLRESLNLLTPKPGEVVVDVTLGLGGHALAFLERIGGKGKLIGIDADERNLEATAVLLERANTSTALSAGSVSESRGFSTRRPFGSPRSKRTEFIHANFRDLPALHLPQCDILFADLGLSSPHLDDPERGFSFRSDAPLDMRFDQTQGESASDLLRQAEEGYLLKIFREYGELSDARPLVKAILTRRKKNPLQRTSDLVDAAKEAYGWKAQKLLPQIFQALRIAVNDEIGALASLLEHGPLLLSQGGRMGVISFHSLEDRMVKQRFASLTPRGAVSQYTLLTPKPIKPTMGEVAANPRARSARLRILRKQ